MTRPPLVEPGPPLTRAQIARYARHLLIPDVGLLGQRRLSAARVLVVGAGGLGSPALLYLAAAGLGMVGICDPDVVDASNLQRQVVHGVSDVGRLKVASAAATLREVNPLVRVIQHPVRLTSGNALEMLSGYDLVVDGTDNFATRYLVNDACALLGIPNVWGSVFRFDGQVSVFWAGHGPCYRCLFPEPPPSGSVPSCAEGGVLGLLCAAVGAAQSTEVVKLVTGIGDTLIGRLLVHDALRATWRELRVRPDPQCAVCGDAPTITRATGLVDYEAFCSQPPATAVGSWADDGVPVVRAAELAAWLDDPARDVLLVDIRLPEEQGIVSIPGSVAVPCADFDDPQALSRIPFDRPVVLYCRSGRRSVPALRTLLDAGHPDAWHLGGGVLAWVDEVDPTLPTY